MKTKRPIAIIAVCTLLALAGGADVIGLVGIVREIARGHVTMWPSVFYAVVAPIFTLGCAAGMWRMRSWSVYLFAFAQKPFAIQMNRAQGSDFPIEMVIDPGKRGGISPADRTGAW